MLDWVGFEWVMPEWVINTSIMFTEVPLLERPAAVARAGFTAMESWWPFASGVPADRDVDAFMDAIGGAGVRLHALNLWSGDHAGGERGVVSHPDRTSEFADSLDVAMAIAERLGCRRFNTLYGRRDQRWTPDHQDRTAVANLELAARAAGRVGGTVLLEPLSGFDDYPLRMPTQCLRVMDAVAAPNVGLLFDIYHLAVNGLDPLVELAGCSSRIAHVQLADHPGRHEPGTGSLDVPAFLRRLAEQGWDGPVALEYVPEKSTTTSLGWLDRLSLTDE